MFWTHPIFVSGAVALGTSLVFYSTLRLRIFLLEQRLTRLEAILRDKEVLLPEEELL